MSNVYIVKSTAECSLKVRVEWDLSRGLSMDDMDDWIEIGTKRVHGWKKPIMFIYGGPNVWRVF